MKKLNNVVTKNNDMAGVFAFMAMTIANSVAAANKTLAAECGKGEVYAFDEVKMNLVVDNKCLVVKSGEDVVKVTAWPAYIPNGAELNNIIQAVRQAISACVASTTNAIQVRMDNMGAAEKLRDEELKRIARGMVSASEKERKDIAQFVKSESTKANCVLKGVARQFLGELYSKKVFIRAFESDAGMIIKCGKFFEVVERFPRCITPKHAELVKAKMASRITEIRDAVLDFWARRLDGNASLRKVDGGERDLAIKAAMEAVSAAG